MTRSEQLVFCKKCLHRKMDMNQGLICSLTHEKATFQEECSDFKHDETVPEKPLDDTKGLMPSELKEKLSPEIFEKIRLEQKPMRGILAGLIAGIMGAILWGVIAAIFGLQIGYVAIAIGAIVGLTIRIFGNGIDRIFGVWGAVISLLSVLLGNFLSIIVVIANWLNLGYIETLLAFDYNYFPQVMGETFSMMHLLFYGTAMVAGYFLSFRRITEKDVMALK